MPGPAGTTATQAIAGGALVAGQNAFVAAAPMMPFTSGFGVGGPEVLGITGALNVIGQWIKGFNFFNQNRWMIPLLLVLGLGIAGIIWHDDIRRAILNGFMAVDTAVKNYGVLREVGVMQPGSPTAKDTLGG